jgi:uncharacterized protein (DUF952 family)
MSEPLLHLALAEDWAAAFTSGEYTASTIGASLADVGFIHLSHPRQLAGVADAFYRDREDVILLAIDPDRLDSEVREEAVPGTDDVFPHLYGPLPVAAVVAAYPLAAMPDGRLDLSPFVGP